MQSGSTSCKKALSEVFNNLDLKIVSVGKPPTPTLTWYDSESTTFLPNFSLVPADLWRTTVSNSALPTLAYIETSVKSFRS